MYPSMSKHIQTYQNVYEHIGMYPSISECIRTYQDVSETIRMYQNVSELIQTNGISEHFPTGTQKWTAGQSKLVNVKTLHTIMMGHLDIFSEIVSTHCAIQAYESRLEFNP